MNSQETIRRRLIELIERGAVQADLAKDLGMSEPSLSAIVSEKRTRKPTMKHADRLAAHLGLSVSDLYRTDSLDTLLAERNKGVNGRSKLGTGRPDSEATNGSDLLGPDGMKRSPQHEQPFAHMKGDSHHGSTTAPPTRVFANRKEARAALLDVVGIVTGAIAYLSDPPAARGTAAGKSGPTGGRGPHRRKSVV